MRDDPVVRWILLPLLFRRCPRHHPEVGDWGDQLPARDHPANRLCTDLIAQLSLTVFPIVPLFFSSTIAMPHTPTSTGKHHTPHPLLTICFKLLIIPHFPLICVYHSLLPMICQLHYNDMPI